LQYGLEVGGFSLPLSNFVNPFSTEFNWGLYMILLYAAGVLLLPKVLGYNLLI